MINSTKFITFFSKNTRKFFINRGFITFINNKYYKYKFIVSCIIPQFTLLKDACTFVERELLSEKYINWGDVRENEKEVYKKSDDPYIGGRFNF